MSTKETNMKINRRKFIGAAATTVTAFTVVPRHVLGGTRFVAPSEKVNIAVVGTGGQGRTNVRALFNEADARIIAVCDPREQCDYSGFYYGGMAGRKPVKDEVEKHYSQKTPNFRCAEYEDFRVMLEKEKDIDAILCATPDHVHAVVSVRAMRMGKHVYCEKPLTHNVWEARKVAQVAKETGVATQMGNQGHSGEGIRQTCEWIWDGAIGPVRAVYAWSDVGRWAVGKGRPLEKPLVPEGFNWDLWLGPREPRPYHPAYAPHNWRGWWAFGTGGIGDMACHNLDPAFWALDLDAPIAVEATSPGVDSEITCYCTIYRFTFGAKGNRPPVKVTWYDGGLRPPHPDGLDPDQPIGDGANGILFMGDKGIITCGGWGGAPRLLPRSKMEQYQQPPKNLPRSKGHHRDWLDACKGGKPASGNFGYSARLTELILLGNVALRTGMKLLWDAPNMKATNAPEADAFLTEKYRSGWEVD
ncbi:MAG: Gfo/Idh/MocA family oxidoreductase [Candidatus Omnitrophica bacterium]|nr:Gfo/Idh/MocA family oxidoreductase [Candidatus Omnitrophota bacterium]